MPTAEVQNPPTFLPPRRPTSLPNLTRAGALWQVSGTANVMGTLQNSPSFLPPRRLSSTRGRRTDQGLGLSPHGDVSKPVSLQRSSSADSVRRPKAPLQRTASRSSRKHRPRSGKTSPARSPNLEPIRDGVPLTVPRRSFPRERSGVLRQSSLRIVSRLSSDDENCPPLPPPAMPGTSDSNSQLRRIAKGWPITHPSSSFDERQRRPPLSIQDLAKLACNPSDPWEPLFQLPTRPPTPESLHGLKPRPSFVRLSSLDNLISYREEKAEWKRASRSSSLVKRESSQADERAKSFAILDDSTNFSIQESIIESFPADHEDNSEDCSSENRSSIASSVKHSSHFRHLAAEIGFCFTIAMTQFLAEYLISGFAIELPRLLRSGVQVGSRSMGIFWPASLLSLILSATLFIFARLSDMYSGYFIFMSGVAWLAVWTTIPGFCHATIWLDVSRAMQGLAIAAFTPSTFAMVGSIYAEGPRRNFVMGLYAGCAPLGFFAGFLTAGALPGDKTQWYFFIAAILAATTLVTAFLSVPSDRTDRRKLGLKMDWIGSFFIMSGLILVSYALAVEPYANELQRDKSAFAFPIVVVPFSSGVVCLVIAFWYEGWRATCPLLPFDFFKPKGVKPFSLACLCFYASYGVWLYNSAQYFQIPTGVIGEGTGTLSGMTLALWYLPTAIGGIVLCVVGGSLMHIIPIMVLLLVSALAWIAAPLLLALAPLPLDYWSFVLPSMLCATIGIDLTFTVSIVYFSSVQPLRYKGLSGAMCSSLVNLAMSFALSISEMVMKQASSTRTLPNASINWGFQATFLYAAASAGVGFILCALFVRISRSVVKEKQRDEEMQSGSTVSGLTLVEENEEQHEILT